MTEWIIIEVYKRKKLMYCLWQSCSSSFRFPFYSYISSFEYIPVQNCVRRVHVHRRFIVEFRVKDRKINQDKGNRPSLLQWSTNHSLLQSSLALGSTMSTIWSTWYLYQEDCPHSKSKTWRMDSKEMKPFHIAVGWSWDLRLFQKLLILEEQVTQ